jgi:hypothetical protein
MKITIEFSTDNAAFADNGMAQELSDVLDGVRRVLVKHASGQNPGMSVRDSNGNTIGQVTVEE